jgi:histidine ammonia-lyase
MAESIHLIVPNSLDLSTISSILSSGKNVALSPTARKAVKVCRAYLDDRLTKSDALIYGINTGFGSLCDTAISKDQLVQLQENLVISHACGMGNEVPREIVKLILLLKIQGLSVGHSGVHIKTIERLIALFNNNITPVVYEQGSLGASGDLAPLAHLSLPLLGRGEVYFNGKRMESARLEELFSWKPIVLGSKEGLALLNGTQFMSAYGAYLLLKLDRLLLLSDLVAALSIDAFLGRTEPFQHQVHAIRPHKGQRTTAANVLNILKDSELAAFPKKHVQDPYSFRCIPQVHGASRDVIDQVKRVFEIEINAVTDNPTIFPDDDLVVSAGNFHGQPLALHLDFLAIAVAELASISERRTYKLISGQRDLPSFLTANPGLNSGFMIPQYTAASIVSQNKQLCTPASVDTIDSSNGQEDHVSMGANSALKAFRVVENYEKVLAIELLNAAQALDFRRPKRSSPPIEHLMKNFRKVVPYVENDVELHRLMARSLDFVKNWDVVS